MITSKPVAGTQLLDDAHLLLKRTGRFNPTVDVKCSHYARFMRNLGRHQADAVFWTLFVTVVVLLLVASSMYAKAVQTFNDKEIGDPETCSKTAALHERVRRRCLIISLVCNVLALPAIIFEVFAALCIEYCDGEDLMMLYWGFWSLIQVGSLIAIFGISLNQWYGLQNKKEPPWATALGTPVLVIAALGHFAKMRIRDVTRGNNAKPLRSIPQSPDTFHLSRVIATAESTPPSGRFIGYSLTNEPLFAYPSVDARNEMRLVRVDAPPVESSTSVRAKSPEESPACKVQFADSSRRHSYTEK